MGKQINYYMGYNNFLSVAQAALDCGCIIYRNSYENGKLEFIGGTTLDTIKKDCREYFFYIPTAGESDIGLTSYEQYLSGYSSLNVIEAGFSSVDEDKKIIYSNRLYVKSGLYTVNGDWFARSDLVTKIYNKLIRVVKKTSPYTEVEHFVLNDMYKGEKFKTKEYISPEFFDLAQNKNYILG